MKQHRSEGNGVQVWWAMAAVVAAGVMVMKPWGALTETEWRWVAGVLGVVMFSRVWGVLRSSSSSGGRIVGWLLALGMAGSVVVVGIPDEWLRLPAWSEVASVVMPMLLGLGALAAVLLGLAGLNRRRELHGAPQRSYVPIVLNLVILVAVWHVVRQPLWKESLRGMMALPQLGSQRQALEASLAPWVEQIQQGSRKSTAEEMAAVALPDATPLQQPAVSTPEADRKTVVTTHHMSGTAPTTSGAGIVGTPASSEEWIKAAIHTPTEPALELRAAIALVAEGREETALSRLSAARERACTSPELIRFHSRLLRAKGRVAAAANCLEDLVLSPAATDQDLHEALSAWEQAGQPERAENLAERALVRRPSRDLFRWLASRDAEAGRFERALVLLGQLSRRTPFEPTDAFQLAEVALKAGRPELALDAITLLEQHGQRSPKLTRLAARARAAGVADYLAPPRRSPTGQVGS